MDAIAKQASVWIDKSVYDEAERIYFEKLAKNPPKKVSLAGEVAKARERIKQSLENVDDLQLSNMSASNNSDVQSRIDSIQDKVTLLRKEFDQVKLTCISLEKIVNDLEKKLSISSTAGVQEKSSTTFKSVDNKDDDSVDLFGSESEDEDEESKKVKEQRLAEYAAKKSKKATVIAKSNIILEVKPWDDETDMEELEKAVRLVQMDGLIWGASKLVPLAYGIHKLQISCVIEDDKVSVDELQEKIEEIEDYVQSVDIAAFNKV